jgi:hypothetical protein
MSASHGSDGIAKVPVHARWRRTRHVVIPAVVVLLAIGAAAYWGPIGLGSGPLEVWMNIGEGWPEPVLTPTGFISPIFNSGGSPTVVDSVELVGGTRYSAPRLLALAG